jgi:uncharacterized protein (TIGR02300 family)
MKGFPTMTKPELGTKRLCAHCGAKFYDLHQAPIICPKCSTVFEAIPVSSRSRALGPREAARQVEPVVPKAAKLVSVEDADAQAQGKQGPGEPAEADDEAGVDDAGLLEEREEDEAEDPEATGDDDDEEDLK